MEWKRTLAGLILVGSLMPSAWSQAPSLGFVPLPETNAVPSPSDRIYPINLATALKLGQAHPLDIALAGQRVQLAAAQLARANVLWLPSIVIGADYYRHDGKLQDVAGQVFDTSKSSTMVGIGPYAVFALSDAVFGPLAARQEVSARTAQLDAVRNDSTLAVAETYFQVQQARGELAAATDILRRLEDLQGRTEKLAEGLIPPVEVVRVRTETARRRLGIHSARERWRTASADLVRIIRLDPGVLVEPLEPPHLQVTLIDPNATVDQLIPEALLHRPELASQKALVEATLTRLRQEKLRPLVPSVLLRGTSTNPGGSLGAGYFGGGLNSNLSNFGARQDFDIQLLWEIQNLGFGNRARVQERKAENQIALFELFRLQDRIAAEVVQAHAQLRSALDRIHDAETGLKDALDSVQKNFEALHQTRRLGENVIVLVVRPQEVIASLQTLAQSYQDYYLAVADYDRAQFRLYRALGTCPGALPALP